MKEVIAGLLRDYGSTIVKTDGTGFRAFLQLVTSKSWQNMERMGPVCGEVLRGQYLYIGPPDIPLNGGEFLRTRGGYFTVRRANIIYLRDEGLFTWGLCVENGVSE